jgi:hypothetical protein
MKMKIGSLLYEPKNIEGFDMVVYYLKRADGTIGPMAENMYVDISCLADSKAVTEHPNWAAISKRGAALRSNKIFNLPWGYVCPTNEQYQSYIWDFISKVAKSNIKGVILNLYHFPEEGFCICKRCNKLWKQSGLGWLEWRAQVVTDFVRQAKNNIKQMFAVEIWPDPILAKERFGLDFEALSEHVDFFHVPLSAHNYFSQFWFDTLTRDFRRILRGPIYIELSAETHGKFETQALFKTMAYVSRHNVDTILLLTHTSKQIENICKEVVHDTELRNWLQERDSKIILDIIDRWEKIYL